MAKVKVTDLRERSRFGHSRLRRRGQEMGSGIKARVNFPSDESTDRAFEKSLQGERKVSKTMLRSLEFLSDNSLKTLTRAEKDQIKALLRKNISLELMVRVVSSYFKTHRQRIKAPVYRSGVNFHMIL